jgi:curli biogenesis system outer membrane secretion channel CsgG
MRLKIQRKVIFFVIVWIILLFNGCMQMYLNTQNASVARENSEIHKIAVLDFEYNRQEYEALTFGNVRRPGNAGVIMADIFTEELMDTGLYRLIERKQIKRILEEHGLEMAGLLKSSSLQELADILDIDGLVMGAVTEFCDYISGLAWGGDVDFSARLVEIKTGEILWTVSSRKNIGNSNSGFAAHASTQSAVEELLKKLKQ